ncbi:MAG TPA: nucleotide-binding domain containing protein, partial [Lacipirellulaceae bacterium]|nr:nucleotide-binding domain containing protein [Lacipirellulaceae bacterium]
VLARETDSQIGLIDIETIGRGRDAVGTALARLSAEGFQAVLFDTTQKSHLQIIGDALWALATEAQTGGPATNCRSAFVVGSSGVEYALCEHWQWSAAISARRHEAYQASRENIVCVSGSCSPVTARQIQYALEHGFVEVPLDPVRLAARSSTYLDVIADETLAALHRGDSVIIHSSRGPDDPRIGAFWRSRETVADSPSAAAIIGSQYGQLLRVVREHSGVRRIAVTGGDKSGYVGRKLGIEALSFVMPVAPGSPLCRIHARPHDALFDGVEIAFKGGQVGFADYLVRVRDGGASGRTAQIRHHAGRETND